MKNYTFFVLFSLLVFISGCSNKLPAHGAVRFEDGTPLESGTVFMSNGMVMFQGGIRKDGRFSIGEWKDGDGIPPGEYRVWIANANKVENIYDKSGERIVRRIDKIVVDRKYESPETSGLSFEIKPDQKNQIEIVVGKP